MAYVNRKVWDIGWRMRWQRSLSRVTDNSRSASQEQTDELRRSRERIGGVSLSGKGRKKGW